MEQFGLSSPNKLELLELTLNNLPDAVILINTDKKVLLTNYRLKEFFNNDNYTIKPGDDLICPDIPVKTINTIIENIRKIKKSVKQDLFLSNTKAWIELNATPIIDENDEINYILLQFKNISTQKYTERALRKTFDSAEKAHLLKTEFLSNISHETRTPLNSILGFAQLLSIGTSLNDEQSKYVNSIIHSGQNLMNLLNDIIELSKLELCDIKIINECFSIKSLIEDIVNIIISNSSNTNVDIKYELNGIDIINSDLKRIKLVLINLIGNAYKFTEKGEVQISLKRENNFYRFTIIDSGIGIEKDFISVIFDDFRKIETGLVRKYQGIGLGLSLSKRVIGLLGGDFSVKSEINKGSVFSFTIPIIETLTHKPHYQNQNNFYPNPDTFPDKNKYRDEKIIYIVDDDISMLNYYKTVLNNYSEYTVKLFSNCDKFINELKTYKNCSLAIIDIEMPYCDGIECLFLLKNINPRIPAIAITAHADTEENDKYIDLGFDNFVVKPIYVKPFIELINKTLN